MPTDNPSVTPLAETAEPVEAEQMDSVTQPEAQAPEVESPAAEPVEGDSQETPAAEEQPKADPPKPEKSNREKLIDQLTGVEEPKSEDEDEEPTPPANPQDKAPVESKDPPKEQPAEEAEDLTELTNESAKAMKPGEARRKVNRLIKRIKEAEPFAAGYREIVETCEANGFSPEDYKGWVGIGIGLQKGDPRAIEAYKQIGLKVGIPAPQPAAAPAPAITAEVEAWLDSQVKDLEISAGAAAELRKRLAPKAPAAPAPAAPAPAPQAPQPTPQPTVDPRAVSRQRAEQAMDKIAADYEEKLGKDRFAELQPRLMAGLKAHKGAHPDAWPSIMRSVITEELAKLPKAAPIQPNLRPKGSGGTSTPQFKTERERAIHKLTSG